MSDKYYVVSQTELEHLVQSCYDRANADAYNHPEKWVLAAIEEVNKTFDGCCSRPVPEWATHFATTTVGLPDLADEERGFRFQEIKR